MHRELAIHNHHEYTSPSFSLPVETTKTVVVSENVHWSLAGKVSSLNRLSRKFPQGIIVEGELYRAIFKVFYSMIVVFIISEDFSKGYEG